ncbi:hypothetical protein EW026_g2258 [Hermanssonia centrifuga]|uniref:Uncharacterized protein n=1 Tax=Hermanssonia centrifuga TaxID=98765 RepID=A0A4S4KNT1_9APHY|nr:hypothetical protein EW026_g2258 [Hermanssonia centrifuga]
MSSSEHNYTSLSELESLSDSDWLDIASSRASEDEDSAAEFDDSDREDADGRPVSRRSFNSIASSRGGVVEGWEGLIEEEIPLPISDSAADYLSLSVAEGTHVPRPSSPPVAEEDPEDERVKAALDQSMMSTLSSSRSNSLANSLQTSLVHSTRALRLSFPDPTTSRLESLNTSFEKLSSSEADPPAPDIDEEFAPFTDEPAADPGQILTPEVSDDDAREIKCDSVKSIAKPDFYVVLYGSSPMAKYEFTDMLLEKWAVSMGLVSSQKVSRTHHMLIRHFDSQGSHVCKSSRRTVCVLDKTGLDHSRTIIEHDCPSLAIIFLPSFSNISLCDHTLYLPVMMSSPPSLVDFLGITDYFLEAEQQWQALAVPTHKLTVFSMRSSPVVEQEALEKAKPSQLQHALRPMFSTSSLKKTMPKVSAHAITLLAVLSMVLGYVVHGSLQSSVIGHTQEHGVTSPLWGLLRPVTSVANRSSSTSRLAMTSSNSALTASSLKDLEVVVFNSATLTLASSPSIARPVSSASSTNPGASRGADALAECDCGCGMLTWPGKTMGTDLILSQTEASSALSTFTGSSNSVSLIAHHPQGKGKAKENATPSDPSLYALSTRIVTSLSEYFDFCAAKKTAHKDVEELIDALDQLVHAIGRQTMMFWEQSKGTVSLLQSGLKQRNHHAQDRARQMREAGVRWISSVGSRIRGRAEVARDNAKSIKKMMGEPKAEKALRRWRGETLQLPGVKRISERRRARRARRGVKL